MSDSLPSVVHVTTEHLGGIIPYNSIELLGKQHYSRFCEYCGMQLDLLCQCNRCFHDQGVRHGIFIRCKLYSKR